MLGDNVVSAMMECFPQDVPWPVTREVVIEAFEEYEENCGGFVYTLDLCTFEYLLERARRQQNLKTGPLARLVAEGVQRENEYKAKVASQIVRLREFNASVVQERPAEGPLLPQRGCAGYEHAPGIWKWPVSDATVARRKAKPSTFALGEDHDKRNQKTAIS